MGCQRSAGAGWNAWRPPFLRLYTAPVHALLHTRVRQVELDGDVDAVAAALQQQQARIAGAAGAVGRQLQAGEPVSCLGPAPAPGAPPPCPGCLQPAPPRAPKCCLPGAWPAESACLQGGARWAGRQAGSGPHGRGYRGIAALCLPTAAKVSLGAMQGTHGHTPTPWHQLHQAPETRHRDGAGPRHPGQGAFGLARSSDDYVAPLVLMATVRGAALGAGGGAWPSHAMRVGGGGAGAPTTGRRTFLVGPQKVSKQLGGPLAERQNNWWESQPFRATAAPQRWPCPAVAAPLPTQAPTVRGPVSPAWPPHRDPSHR